MVWNAISNLTMSMVDGRGISTIDVGAQLLLSCRNEITLFQKHFFDVWTCIADVERLFNVCAYKYLDTLTFIRCKKKESNLFDAWFY